MTNADAENLLKMIRCISSGNVQLYDSVLMPLGRSWTFFVSPVIAKI